MNRFLRILVSCIILSSFIYRGYIYGLTAVEIVKKSDDLLRGKTSAAEMSMEVVRPEWSRKVRMKVWSKGSDYSLILITSPARDKGSSFLKINNEVWNWVPSIERTIKIPPSMMMQSWMGSDFTNDDLVKESSIVKDYYHKITGDSVINDSECYVIELTPKPEAPVVWGKILLWITKKDYLELRVEFYDEEGYPVNVMTASKIKKMDDRFIPTYMEMVPVEKKGHKTVLEYYSVKFNRKIKDNFFSIQNMKRVR